MVVLIQRRYRISHGGACASDLAQPRRAGDVPAINSVLAGKQILLRSTPGLQSRNIKWPSWEEPIFQGFGPSSRWRNFWPVDAVGLDCGR